MSRSLQIFQTAEELRQWRISVESKTVGFVPTMGALHRGHAELLKRVRPKCDLSVLSIFVNPTQFGPKEDLAKYPRTFEKDLALAQENGVDVIFAPQSTQMYPEGYSTYVEENTLSQPLCGQFRPGHFRGVTTVVLKLFNLVRPQIALFGLKDAQQFFVLSKMVKDLNLDITVLGIPTVREDSGLALSSRNAYLSNEEKQKASKLYEALNRAKLSLQGGTPVYSTLEAERTWLKLQGFELQYFDLLELPNLNPSPLGSIHTEKPYLLATAAYLGTTRLIDNVILNSNELARFNISIET